jgi:hypothetical protein
MTPEQLKILEFAAFGFLGGVIGVMARSERLALPRIVAERQADGQVVRFIDPGFLASCLLGALLAAWRDGRPETAIVYGLASGYVGPALLKRLIERLLKHAGLDSDTPAAREDERVPG